MQSACETDVRERKARVPETHKGLAKLRSHLNEIIESAAFRGSHRSAQFLRFICEQALSGNLESLKERTIGVELFGRSPSYDTGEDAIVRVTASDVRKRLSTYYLSPGRAPSELRISVPVGSYVPEFIHDLPASVAAEHAETALHSAASEADAGVSAESSGTASALPPPSIVRNPWFWVSVCLMAVSIALVVRPGRRAAAVAPPAEPLPWSAIFAEKRGPLLITSDPNIAEIQGLTNQPVSVSDYANQQYIPNPAVLSPLLVHICSAVLRGDKAANVDTKIVAAVAELAAGNAAQIHVRAARDLHFSDFDTEGSLIFLGSPRTDPWTALFDDQLDFRFRYDNASRQEIIQNAHPRPGEPSQYIPTAKGFATGQSFALVSFIRNPNHAGNVLIMAGANAEGTRAAGEFLTTGSSLSSTLQSCGLHRVPATGSVPHFQVLLRVRTMAGSPTAFDVVTCHALP
jgi:hypothetical protein